MRFLGSKFTQNALAAGAPDPAGGARALLRPPNRFQGAASRQRKGNGGEIGRRGGERGNGEGKEEGRAKGREEGETGEGGREGEFASLALGGIDAPGHNWTFDHIQHRQIIK